MPMLCNLHGWPKDHIMGVLRSWVENLVGINVQSGRNVHFVDRSRLKCLDQMPYIMKKNVKHN